MLSIAPFITAPAATEVVAIVPPDIVTCTAILIAVAFAVWTADKAALNARAMYWAAVCALVPGLWGAHVLSLLVHGWSGGVLAFFEFVEGGKSLYGGLLLGGVAAGFYFHWRKLPVLAFADAAMPGVALGYAIGRIGCFLNGDDYGALTRARWAVIYAPGTEAYQAHLARGWISATDAWSLPVHPVQLYSSLVGVGLFMLLVAWRPERAGSKLCAYLALYGVCRFFMEYVRGDFEAVLGPFSLPQLFSAAFVLLGMVIWLSLRAPEGHREVLNIALQMESVMHGEP